MSTPKFTSPQEGQNYIEGMARVRMRKSLAAAVNEEEATKKQGQTAKFFANAAAGGVRKLSRGKRTYKFFSTLAGTRTVLSVS
jgi:hypothetical protein